MQSMSGNDEHDPEQHDEDLSSPKHGHTTGGACRIDAVHGGRRGGAKLGRTGCRHFGRAEDQLSLYPSSIPGHALHEEGLQRQIAVDTLVNSQQRRALAVPRLNRGQTAGQPLVLFLHRFT